MYLVDVVKHLETGARYAIPHGNPLPNDKAYTYLARNVSQDEARDKWKVGKRLNPKQKC